MRSHSLIARALYSVVPVDSAPRNFTVAAHVPAKIDSVRDAVGEVQNGGQTKSTSVNLQGVVTAGHQVQILDNGAQKLTVTATGTSWNATLAVGLTPTNPPAGSFIVRTASGGVPPYQYTSSNSAAAEVNASTGRVISKGNGSAVITVRDSAGQSAAFPVGVSNVFRIFGTGVFNTYTQCHNAAVSQGGRIPSLAEWRSYINTYAGIATEREWCWAADQAGIGKRWAIFPATGETKALVDFGIGGNTASGYGIR